MRRTCTSFWWSPATSRSGLDSLPASRVLPVLAPPTAPADITAQTLDSVLNDDTTNLDQHQARGVASMMVPHRYTLVQGPPGTGKSRVLANAVRLFATAWLSPQVPRGKVLVTAESNVAVDNVLSIVRAQPWAAGLSLTRFGDEERMGHEDLWVSTKAARLVEEWGVQPTHQALQNARNSVKNSSDVCFATLAKATSAFWRNDDAFAAVVIDEAGNAKEPTMLPVLLID